MFIGRLIHYARVLGPKGAAGSLIGKLSGRPARISIRRGDLPHPITLRVPSSDADAYEQIFLQSQYRFDVRQAPDVIVDAGANIGLASIYFASKFPRARIFAIECEKSNFEVLKANVEPYANIVPIHAALWDHDGEVEIVDPGLGKWGFMTATRAQASGAATSVRALTLDSLMREHGITHIDILKIDIEGAEFEVFNASAPWIGNVDTVIAELHDRLKAGCERSFADATAEFRQRWQRGENVYVARAASCVVAAA